MQFYLKLLMNTRRVIKIIYQEPLMTSRERDDALLGAVEDHYEGDSTDELVEDPANLPAVDQPPEVEGLRRSTTQRSRPLRLGQNIYDI